MLFKNWGLRRMFASAVSGSCSGEGMSRIRIHASGTPEAGQGSNLMLHYEVSLGLYEN